MSSLRASHPLTATAQISSQLPVDQFHSNQWPGSTDCLFSAIRIWTVHAPSRTPQSVHSFCQLSSMPHLARKRPTNTRLEAEAADGDNNQQCVQTQLVLKLLGDCSGERPREKHTNTILTWRVLLTVTMMWQAMHSKFFCSPNFRPLFKKNNQIIFCCRIYCDNWCFIFDSLCNVGCELWLPFRENLSFWY